MVTVKSFYIAKTSLAFNKWLFKNNEYEFLNISISWKLSNHKYNVSSHS